MNNTVVKNTPGLQTVDSVVPTAQRGAEVETKWYHNLKYSLAGCLFGVFLVKGEILSWFRIQEMFGGHSPFLFGVLSTAVAVGALSVAALKKFGAKTFGGKKIEIRPKRFNKGQVWGGLLFGSGWVLTGACPGPLFAQIGSGALASVAIFLSATAGTWLYGYCQNKLPH